VEDAIKWRAVVPLVRGPPRCGPRQFLTDAGDARGDQGLVADAREGAADQDLNMARGIH
jgi:hypothetical protein